MGSCFSKKTKTTTPVLPPSPLYSAHHHQPPPNTTTNDPPVLKKEIFVIKHRVSHELDRHSDQQTHQNPSCSNEQVDPILPQYNLLTRSNSAGSQNPTRRRRHSRSKRSFDLGFNNNNNINNNNDNNNASDAHQDDIDVDVDDDEDAVEQHQRHRNRNRNRNTEVRGSGSGRYSSKERRISISPSRGSSSKERRISVSPSRRSESPFGNKSLNSVVVTGSSDRPVKMVSVPATDKSNNAGVKRINVKRNVSPARASIRVFSDDQSEKQESGSSTRESDRRRKSLVEIDNNAGRCARRRDTKRTRRLSRDLDVKPETGYENSLSLGQSLSPSPSPPSYASLLLEDIQNFHKKNTTSAATTQPSFAIPECVNKACLIMEAVADMNSNTSSLCSDDRWRNSTTVKKESSGTVVNGSV